MDLGIFMELILTDFSPLGSLCIMDFRPSGFCTTTRTPSRAIENEVSLKTFGNQRIDFIKCL
jgi:hypothetical protein